MPSPPLVLIFGPFDPSGSSNLPADAVTCALLGGHALSVLTGTHVQDTAGIEEIHSATFDLIDDQARCLRSGEHTSELQSLMRNAYADFCLNKKQIEHVHRTNRYSNVITTSNI